MPELPTLGESPKQNPMVGVAIAAAVVGVLAGGAYWWKSRTPAEQPPAPVAAAQPAPVDAAAPAPSAAPGTAPAAVAAAPAAAPLVPVAKGGLKSFSAKIAGPLEAAVVGQVGKQVGQPLTQVVNRSLVWWLDVPQDLVKNDVLDVVYEERDGQEPLVHAVRYQSAKRGKTFACYRYKTETGAFARLYDSGGEELEQHLVDGPLEEWEQITSLLRDGRRHKGVDFKTPVGSQVRATFDGTITRKNWNFRGNGNSLEIAESGGQGRTAMYLHLSELPRSIQPGQHVKRGEVIAKSGNTGHSFAPHLHYQLMQGERVVDPFESHSTSRASLAQQDRTAFERAVASWRARLPVETTVGAGR